MNSAGIILCGGQSKRMGQPKAWLPFLGERMLPRVVRLLGQVVAPLVVVAAPDQELPPLPAEVTVVRDEEKGWGPLMGLAVGLKALQGQAEAAFLSSCDVPLLQPAFVARMIELRVHHAVCVPRVGDRFHPLAAVYRLDVLAEVQRLLHEQRLRPVFLFETVPTRIVTADELADVDPDLQSLCNLNTPEEYQAALRFAEESRCRNPSTS